jgi:hypothetical protein
MEDEKANSKGIHLAENVLLIEENQNVDPRTERSGSRAVVSPYLNLPLNFRNIKFEIFAVIDWNYAA